jgi:hypothetical protein
MVGKGYTGLNGRNPGELQLSLPQFTGDIQACELYALLRFHNFVPFLVLRERIQNVCLDFLQRRKEKKDLQFELGI